MALVRADFAAFFASVHDGQRPFAWQERLLDSVLEQGRWPDRVVAPTGSGKTAVIDVHVFATAVTAATSARIRLPRRLALVVARRVVVDSHDEHARSVAGLLIQGGGVLSEVAAALTGLRLSIGQRGEAVEPLVTARLRGGVPPPRSWLDSPEACAVLTATPDMLGSRLLMQGYGSSSRAWPREAGLLALDTVVVVDEAHLSRQLLRTARRVGDLTAASGTALTGAVPALQVVETSATPEQGGGTEVGVTPEDLSDEVLAARLTRPKPVSLHPVADWPLTGKGSSVRPSIGAVVDAVRATHAAHGSTVGCVLNRVAAAVEVASRLREGGLSVELLVGRQRPADVDALRRRRPGLLSIQGSSEVDVLVATQTVEVGVDLDLAALVTELAPGAALAQRSGRVNRVGRRESGPITVVVPAKPPVAGDEVLPYDAVDLADALQWCERRAADPAGFAPWAIRTDPPPGQASRRTLLQRVEVSDSWLFARTGDDLAARPDLALWLADDLAADLDVGLVCRVGVADDATRATAVLRALPPQPHETFPVSISGLRQLLDTLAAVDDPSGIVLLHRPDEVLLVDPAAPPALRPGDVLVVDASTPVQREGVVTVAAALPADDVLEHAVLDRAGRLAPRPGRLVLRWGAGSLLGPLPGAASDLLEEGPQGQGHDWTRDQRAAFGAALRGVAPDTRLTRERRAELEACATAAADLLERGRVRDLELIVADDIEAPVLLMLVDRRRAVADEDARQVWSPGGDQVPLDVHAEAVAAAVGDLARRVGVSSAAVAALTDAGLHHDDGKADQRFQASLGAEPGGPLLAKSGRRSLAEARRAKSRTGLEKWRHEQLSVALARPELPAEHRDIASRLIGTTHGHGRLGFPHGSARLLGGAADPGEAVALFDEGGWERMMERTDREHGVWVLAYLEALLRAADGRVSGAGS